ncbi:Uu.00g135600.m01.CDS01 [Anthostomella pinea]|uniref:Uu.00g135600.m01.CDS01 n=1 Tax=Anthostomella pinea TaxID=933095 RepID=A0AAI8VP84_9PEZI|nr:Uu.00g135600.m01.CDS01 [Anthostomella pinea]
MLDEALERSERRRQILEELLDLDAIRERLTSCEIYARKWQLTGDEKVVKRELASLDAAIAPCERWSPGGDPGGVIMGQPTSARKMSQQRLWQQGKDQWQRMGGRGNGPPKAVMLNLDDPAGTSNAGFHEMMKVLRGKGDGFRKVGTMDLRDLVGEGKGGPDSAEFQQLLRSKLGAMSEGLIAPEIVQQVTSVARDRL